MFSNKKLSSRPIFLATGVLSMLFSGIIYAWSILKIPFAELYGFSNSSLAFNFTLTMCTFCIGGFLGGKIFRKIGVSLTVIISGILTAVGFIGTAFISGKLILLYVFYALFAGLGIGIAYNVIISTVNAWFPDKKGLCSGTLMMAFGASTLIMGKVIEGAFQNESIGWQKTYIIFGVALAAALILSGLILKLPAEDIVFPEAKAGKRTNKESFEEKDYTTSEMMKRSTFWRAFLCLVCLTAVGSSVISFARDLVLSVGAEVSLASTLVGILSICNGLGRIFTGALFDSMGRRVTMITANIITIFAAGVTLAAVYIGSLPLCIIGLCLTGISYGSCPTVASAFVAAFYGKKYFPTNFSAMNFQLLFASFIATANSSLLSSSGGYVVPFILLLSLSVAALGLNFSIRRP